MQLLYNDLSPMENHHSAAAFGIMRQPGNNFMDHLPRKVSKKYIGAAGRPREGLKFMGIMGHVPRKVRIRRAGAGAGAGAGATYGQQVGQEGHGICGPSAPHGQL